MQSHTNKTPSPTVKKNPYVDCYVTIYNITHKAVFPAIYIYLFFVIAAFYSKNKNIYFIYDTKQKNIA